MGHRSRAAIAALVISVFMLTGCWGYNRSARRGAYVLDSVLILGGGGLVALGVTNPPKACDMGPNLPPDPACHDPVAGKLNGPLVAGSMLVIGGLVAFIVNATRSTVKTSR